MLTNLQSESCGLAIPEIELVLQAGTLGGRFTTLEGILDQVYEELSEKVFASGDAVGDNGAFENFLKKLKAVCSYLFMGKFDRAQLTSGIG